MRASELLPRFLQDRATLARIQVEADRVIAAALAGHLVHDLRPATGRPPDRPWRLDPIPYLLDGPAFDALAATVRQRMQAMELVLADLYGPRRVLREAWIPAEVLASSPRYRMTTVGTPPPRRWLTSYALDVVALADGSWRVVQDLTDTPTGVAYALLDRSVMARVGAELLGADGARDVASISSFPVELRHALTAATTTRSPRVVLFTGGVDEPAYVEHSALARQLGFHLVEGPDLVVRQGRLWLRTVTGLEPIDVVYRRLSDVAVDPMEAASVGADGVPGLLFAAAGRGVVLANAHGTGVVEDPDLALCWPPAAEALTGAALRVSALLPGDALATVPSFVDGQVQFAAVVVRLHAVASDDGVTVMAGGNGRVLADGDDPRRPTARLAKDVWVLGADRSAPVLVAPPLPQVDLGASVPTRAADAMFFAGRAAERAEAIARTARVVAARRLEDPLLVSLDGGRWARRTAAALRMVTGAGAQPDGAPADPLGLVDGELRAASAAVVGNVATLIADATAVGEYLSVTAGRVLRSLGEVTEGRAPIDVLDATIVDLAALSGLWNENTVRGPAWRFGDIGRRVERALVVLGLIESCLGPIDPADVIDTSVLEVVLAANESLVAYRRRYRSDVELDPAVELLLHDRDNSAPFAASVDRLAAHVEAIGWAAGVEAVRSMAATLAGDRPLDRVASAAAEVAVFGELVVATWFATPVRPMLVQASV